jgi:hypothetical protein
MLVSGNVALHSARAVTYVRNLLIDLSGYEDVEVCREFRTYAEIRLPSLRHASRR